ncbi:MAG TPA: hypothetical protein VFT79_04890 [Solirubrobacterales bacterium]|nr:hypothetical protein [Solirubrobacterales bacterium]
MKKLVAICLSVLPLLGAAADANPVPGTAPLAGPALVIQANSAGVQNLGGFHPLRNPTVGAAVRAFGRPSSRQPRYGGSGCDVSWRKIGLKMTFAYYGGGGRWAACQGGKGVAKTALIQGLRADRWQTSRGVRIGDSLEQLERSYPNAVEWEGDYWLAIGYTPIGDGGSYPVLAALVQSEAVRGFEVLMSPAYD